MKRKKLANRKLKLTFRILGIILFAALAVIAIMLAINIARLDERVTSQFEGKRWELPARVYARPKDLFVGQTQTLAQLRFELEQLHYKPVPVVQKPGEFREQNGVFEIFTRGFNFPDEYQDARHIKLVISGGVVDALKDVAEDQQLNLFRLEPVRIANIYPKHHEDRVLVKLDQVPTKLLAALISIEDQDFYQHHGVQPKAILRAVIANIKAGRTVQGGSTLTQQLVKNFYLTNERTVSRKLNEALMALLLEWHYEKNEILEAYLNEIYLGQDGVRAIHGFGLASQFYFQRDLAELPPEQLYLLVGMAKGASYYDPRRFPERATKRRNLVITTLVREGLLEEEAAQILIARPLGVTAKVPSGVTSFPAFLDLVRRQLKRDYRDEDLSSEGLVIFTTFDPLAQSIAEEAVVRKLDEIEKAHGIEPGTLQGAMAITTAEQGEVVAMVGGRDPRYAGFNRVLDMKRPVGSLIKPAVYLTALARAERYNLLTQLDDSELVMPQPTGEEWRPQNYDKEFHANVSLLQGLVFSYNIASVRLGLELGLEEVVKTLKALGIESTVEPFPSMLLGATDLTLIEALQMYQTIAAGGYKTPLRSILAVVNQQGQTLQRYTLEVDQAVPADADFLLTTAMHHVTTSGTGRALQYLLPKSLRVAGKTGTTNELRDSWFGGFSGEHVGVAWVGRDDNKSTGLTGSSGALRVWAEAFAKLPTQPLQPLEPDTILWAKVDVGLGVLLEPTCNEGIWLPFSERSMLPETIDCEELRFRRSLPLGVEAETRPGYSSELPAINKGLLQKPRGLFH